MYKLLLPLLLVSSTLSAQIDTSRTSDGHIFGGGVNRSPRLDSEIIFRVVSYSGLNWAADTIGTISLTDSPCCSWYTSDSFRSRHWNWLGTPITYADYSLRNEIKLLTRFRKATDAYIAVLDLEAPVTSAPNVWFDHLWQCRKRYISAKKALQAFYKKNPQR